MPIPDSASCVTRRSLRDTVYPTLREWIVTCALAPGELLKDREIAERLGVSRTPVREALQRLSDEGFVQIESNRWTRVAPIDDDMVREVYEITSALESAATTAASPHLTSNDFDAMERANAQLAVALRMADGVEASRADAAFHEILVQRCGNSRMLRMLDDLRAQLSRAEITYFRGSGVASSSIADHERILDALRSGAHEEAVSAVRANWDESFQRLRERQT